MLGGGGGCMGWGVCRVPFDLPRGVRGGRVYVGVGGGVCMGWGVCRSSGVPLPQTREDATPCARTALNEPPTRSPQGRPRAAVPPAVPPRPAGCLRRAREAPAGAVAAAGEALALGAPTVVAVEGEAAAVVLVARGGGVSGGSQKQARRHTKKTPAPPHPTPSRSLLTCRKRSRR